ncbi:uncharacterized protein B0H18DRAFT_989577 [Fomitopsis serialis]|uniref:uncharacterized protein n=1 Tax=Fomitopsis serialis TaxID=139415 RepID=UPI0020073B14|nr:uncharacterized protein B0H18DRAFT_989577 [Neoantrodia serialis]KAH9931486.1 hypothetical protein B0H18DRAFT_989577 [Neoantrodia serialis]
MEQTKNMTLVVIRLNDAVAAAATDLVAMHEAATRYLHRAVLSSMIPFIPALMPSRSWIAAQLFKATYNSTVMTSDGLSTLAGSALSSIQDLRNASGILQDNVKQYCSTGPPVRMPFGHVPRHAFLELTCDRLVATTALADEYLHACGTAVAQLTSAIDRTLFEMAALEMKVKQQVNLEAVSDVHSWMVEFYQAEYLHLDDLVRAGETVPTSGKYMAIVA